MCGCLCSGPGSVLAFRLANLFADTMFIFSNTFQASINRPADHQPCRVCVLSCWFFLLWVLCLWCFCVFFVWFFGFACLLLVLHGDSSIDYVSIQFSSLLYAHCRYD